MVVKVPEPPLLAAGAIGGPFVMYLVTPLRNALTMGAVDSSKSVITLYRDVFSQGLAKGFQGGQFMAVAAVPGFLVLGPCFHIFNDLVGGNAAAAVGLTALAESGIFYGSETKNAQIAFNQSQERKGGPKILKLQSQLNPIGPGIGLHVTRNYLAMSGLRVFSKPCQDAISTVSPNMSSTAKGVLGDLIANIFVSAVSAPLHQLYGFSCTQRLLSGPESAQESFMTSSKAFLKAQYLTPAGRISSVAARDIFLRVAYNASIFTLFGSIERTFVSYWPKSLMFNS